MSGLIGVAVAIFPLIGNPISSEIGAGLQVDGSWFVLFNVLRKGSPLTSSCISRRGQLCMQPDCLEKTPTFKRGIRRKTAWLGQGVGELILLFVYGQY